jgi:hypothetical protein
MQTHTFASHTNQRLSQSLQKSVSAPTQKKIQNIFPFPSKKIKTLVTQTNTTKTYKLNRDIGLQTRWTRTPAANSGFASCGVTVVSSSAVFQINFSAGLTVLCLEIPHERKAAKRYQQA